MQVILSVAVTSLALTSGGNIRHASAKPTTGNTIFRFYGCPSVEEYNTSKAAANPPRLPHLRTLQLQSRLTQQLIGALEQNLRDRISGTQITIKV